MQKDILILVFCSSLLLTGCESLPAQHPDSSIKTHNICYEIRQQILQNKMRNQPEEQGNSPIEEARLYQLYKKYHCEESEPGALRSQANANSVDQ